MDKREYRDQLRKGWDSSFTGIYIPRKGKTFFILEFIPDNYRRLSGSRVLQVIDNAFKERTSNYFRGKPQPKGYFAATRIEQPKQPITAFRDLPRRWEKII